MTVFHFYPWDYEYGEPFTDREIFVEQQRLGYVRDSVYNLVTRDYTGIDSTARTIANQFTNRCLYCQKHFRNPNALKLHMEDSHGFTEESEPSVPAPAPIQLVQITPPSPTFYILVGNRVLSDPSRKPLRFKSRQEARNLINTRVIPNSSIVDNIHGIIGRRTYKWLEKSDQRAN